MCTKNNKCNFTSCRFNAEGICENEEAREDCVDMSRKVLCLDNEADMIKACGEFIGEHLPQCKFQKDCKVMICRFNQNDKCTDATAYLRCEYTKK